MHDRDALPEVSLSRRAVLSTTASAGAGLLGLGVYVTGDASATASVSADGLAVADGQYDSPDGEVATPVVTVDVGYSYAAVDRAAQVMVAMLIDGTLVDDRIVSVSESSTTGSETLSGDVVESRAWSGDDWHAPNEGEVSHTIEVELRLEVRNADGGTLADDAATDTAEITVTDAGPTVSASVGGDGTIQFREDDGDTPTA